MNFEKVALKSVNDYSLSLALFDLEKPKAIIQMVHGMEEHKERYYEFAEYLNKNGYAVVVSDLRGHGSEAPILSHIADKKGEELLIKDQQEITKYINNRYKEVPIYLFAHSMGTIISRVLLQTDSKKYAKVALSGYVNPNPISGVAVFLGNTVKLFKGSKKKSKLLTSLAMGPFTKAVKERKTDLDWLSYNEENVKKYIEDPLCGVEFTIGSYSALFHLLNQMGKYKKYKDINKDTPILLISGKDDPCTGSFKGREDSKSKLVKAGYKDISVITYENMRHEILNEKDKEKVMKDILEFFEK